MIVKVGEAMVVAALKDGNVEKMLGQADDPVMSKRAKRIRQLIPKPEDFLIASAIMMHAAEASLIDQDTGEPVLNKSRYW